MIKISGLGKSYGDQVLFSELDLAVNSGEKVGLVGRNGHGKTTLFHILMGLEEPDSGSIMVPRGYRIGYLQQHLNFKENTVLEEACLGLPPDEMYDSWKAEKILSGLGFSESDMAKHPSLFSGGYQIRLNLAKLLVSKPDMLLLDEPNNYLDIVAIRWLESFLKSWRGEFMLITHDRSFMDNVVTHTAFIHRQKMRKVAGGTEKLYSQIAMEEEIYEKTRLNDEKKRRQVELFIARFKAKARFASRAQSRIKALEKQEVKEKLENIENLEFEFNSAHFPAAQMLAAHNICFSYSGKEPYLIQDFNIEIGKRERICIIGKNGKGKTTLLKLLAGELKPLNGNIKKHAVLREGYFGQTNKLELNDSKTVLEEIMSADSKCGLPKARNIAGGLMFPDDTALKKIAVLSGGEKSRVLRGKILAAPAHILFLDEPTNHLDMQSCDSLVDAIDSFDGSVVLVTHNEMYLNSVATRLVVFDDDRIIVYNGNYKDFLEDVGWSSENEGGKPKKEKKKKNTTNEKDVLKREKAKLVKERSTALSPLENEKKKLEDEISGLERQLHKDTEELIKASNEGNAGHIAEFSKKTGAAKGTIEVLFEKLDRITCEFENRSQQYDKKIAELENSEAESGN